MYVQSINNYPFALGQNVSSSLRLPDSTHRDSDCRPRMTLVRRAFDAGDSLLLNVSDALPCNAVDGREFAHVFKLGASR